MSEKTFIVKDSFSMLSRRMLIISGKLFSKDDVIKKGDLVKIDEYFREIDAIEVINSSNEGYIGLLFNFQEKQDILPLELLKNNDAVTILSENK
jgi:hypothetical protein